jgi:ABC-type sugar transport system ATPase subunit
MTQQQPLLKMEGITKEYFGNRVLTDVSLDVNRGEVLGLVGENGAGKSTLMNILFGMRIEDTVIVKENGCTPITDLDKDLVIVR